MKVILKGRDEQHGVATYETSVTELQYDFRSGQFGHPFVFLGDLYTYTPCELNIVPEELILRYDGAVVITFASSQDAAAFKRWLEEIALKAQESFLTLKG